MVMSAKALVQEADLVVAWVVVEVGGKHQLNRLCRDLPDCVAVQTRPVTHSLFCLFLAAEMVGRSNFGENVEADESLGLVFLDLVSHPHSFSFLAFGGESKGCI